MFETVFRENQIELAILEFFGEHICLFENDFFRKIAFRCSLAEEKKMREILVRIFLPGDIDGILRDVNRVNFEAVILRHKNLSAPDSTANRQNSLPSFWVYLKNGLKSPQEGTVSLPSVEATVQQPFRQLTEIRVRRFARIAQFSRTSISPSLLFV